MKKDYEVMEAYKVEFNANEQVAAAACQVILTGGKYNAAAADGTCYIIEAIQDKYMLVSPGDGLCMEELDASMALLQYA